MFHFNYTSKWLFIFFNIPEVPFCLLGWIPKWIYFIQKWANKNNKKKTLYKYLWKIKGVNGMRRTMGKDLYYETKLFQTYSVNSLKPFAHPFFLNNFSELNSSIKPSIYSPLCTHIIKIR